MFEVRDNDGLSRIGRLKIGNKVVETPYLMPVINPNINSPSLKELLERFKIPMIITNAYIIYKTPDLREKALSQGIHKTLGFDGIIETDSGAYQLMVYGDVDITNDEIVRFQEAIGSDIANPLDVPPTPDDPKDVIRAKCRETVKRVHRARDLLLNSRLSLPIQGGVHLDLREKYCKEVEDVAKEAEIIAIGGIVPYLELQRISDIVKIITTVKKVIGHGKPYHGFGVGHPLVIPIMIACGIDLFDSASYALYALDDRVLLPYGTKSLHELSELPCECPICSKYEKEELVQMEKSERQKLLALHNLYVLFAELRRCKQAIKEGSFFEYLEYRCSCHPELMDSLRLLYEETSLLKSLVKIGKKHMKLVHELSLNRPELEIYKRIKNNVYKKYEKEYDLTIEKELPETMEELEIVINEEKSKYENKSVLILFKTPFGLVPDFLIECFPFIQYQISSHLKNRKKANDS